MEQKTDREIAMHVSRVSIAVNLLLSLGKFLAGVFANSGAMISDAVHSASDVFSTIIVMIGVEISSKESDEGHQYGHERLECVASLILAIILFATGAGIGLEGIRKVMSGRGDLIAIPGLLALVAALISIVVKEWMYWYTKAAAGKINSGALMADAWHHRSDALSSVGALVGIVFARMGFPMMDSIASIGICIFIIKAAIDIFKDAIDKMVDKSCDEETMEQMREVIASQEGVLNIDRIQTRLFGSRIYVDIEIAADGNKTLNETHHIAEMVHDQIEHRFPMVKHCMVHVNPKGEKEYQH